MAKVTLPPDIHIAALERKKVVDNTSLMTPGQGTPWEDRGHLGGIKAFFLTAGWSLISPLKLLHAIRRPESTSDVRGFLIGCGVFWGISAVVHSVLLRIQRGEEWEPAGFRAGVVVLFVLAPVMLWLAMQFATLILSKLNSLEAGNRAPAVLTYNMLSYLLGPSLLTPLPVVGPPLAIVWITALAIAGSVSRLRLKVGTACVNVLLTATAVLASMAGAIVLLRILFAGLMTYFA